MASQLSDNQRKFFLGLVVVQKIKNIRPASILHNINTYSYSYTSQFQMFRLRRKKLQQPVELISATAQTPDEYVMPEASRDLKRSKSAGDELECNRTSQEMIIEFPATPNAGTSAKSSSSDPIPLDADSSFYLKGSGIVVSTASFKLGEGSCRVKKRKQDEVFETQNESKYPKVVTRDHVNTSTSINIDASYEL